MINVEEVAERIYRVEVHLPQLNTIFAVYLIREEMGVLIDPGPTLTIPFIEEAMKQLGMKELAYIIPTHIHIDHAGSTGSLLRIFPYAKAVLHPSGAKHAINPSRLIESTKISFGDDFELRYGCILPASESQVITPGDEEIISIDGRELQIIYAPGHATHHIAIFDRKTKGLFCGEALGVPIQGGASLLLPVAAPPSFDMELYLRTMDRLSKLDPQLLFYAHDGVGRKPKELVSRASEITKIFGGMILEALREGETTEAIDYRIRGYISGHLGVNGEEVDMQNSIEGFIHYFKNKGLV